ncbi:MAG: Phosphoribosylglycinamide formyltransferase [bacterium]|nr:Phosphoribosylglycinamide formyltransferase [bacterium]
MTTRPRLAIFLSGRGSNAEAILRAIDDGTIAAEVGLVVSNTAKAGGLALAQRRGIPALPLNPNRYPTPALYAADLLRWLRHYRIDALVLAGYLKQIPPAVIAAYAGRILNIHPALLPKHGGPGMYGLRVHAAVLNAGETESGATVHLVTEEYDEGPVLARARVPVLEGDTPESLAHRVLAAEHQLYPLVIAACVNALRAGTPFPQLGTVVLPAGSAHDVS